MLRAMDLPLISLPNPHGRIRAVQTSNDDHCLKHLPPIRPGQNSVYCTLDLALAPRIDAQKLKEEASKFAAVIEKSSEHQIGLRQLLENIERRDDKGSWKVWIEAVFGKTYWRLPPAIARQDQPPQTLENWEGKLYRPVFNPHVDTRDTDILLKDKVALREAIAIDRVPKVKFVIPEGPDEGKYCAVVNEDQGIFSLDYVFQELSKRDFSREKQKSRVQRSITLPGRKYDLRINCCANTCYSESMSEQCTPFQIAREITGSMNRGPDRKISLKIRGKTVVDGKETEWRLRFLRQVTQRCYEWKSDGFKRWVLIKNDVDEFLTEEISANREWVKQQPLNMPVEIRFDCSRQEVELHGLKVLPNQVSPREKEHHNMMDIEAFKLPGEPPRNLCDWTAEDFTGDFEEFVEDAFKVAHILDGSL